MASERGGRGGHVCTQVRRGYTNTEALLCSRIRFRFLLFLFSSVLRARRRKSGKNRRAFEQPRPFVVDSNWPTPRKLIRWNFARDRLFSYRFGTGRRTEAGTASPPSQPPPTPNAYNFQDSTVLFWINLLLEAIF